MSPTPRGRSGEIALSTDLQVRSRMRSFVPSNRSEGSDMSAPKRITDLTSYTTVLPYASELFGVYQPLLGWKCKRIDQRYKEGHERDKRSILDKLKREFADAVTIDYREGNQVSIQVRPGVLKGGKIRPFDSAVLDRIAQKLPTHDKYTPAIWAEVLAPARME